MDKLFVILFVFAGCYSSSTTNTNEPVKKNFAFQEDSTQAPEPVKLVLTQKGQKIIHLNAGAQPGVDANGKSNITYLADSGVVIFTSQIKLGNTRNIKFDGQSGFKYAGNDYSVFNSGMGNNCGDTIRNFDFGNTASTVFDAMTKIFVAPDKWLTFNGKPETTVFWGLTVDHFKLSGRTSLFQGPFEANPTYHMVSAGITFTNGEIINDGTGDNQKIRGYSFYGLKVDHLKITGPTISGNGDYGIVYIFGTGVVKNVFRNGGWGYLERIVLVKMDKIPFDQTCGMYNCTDINSTRYGTVDIRMEKDQMNTQASIPLKGCDFYYQNNVSGNKKDDGYYVTNAVVLGPLKDEQNKLWTVHIKDNVAFNAMVSAQSNASSLVKNNSSDNAIIDSSGNIDVAPGKSLPAGILDASYRPIKTR
jgi:hypothetical protein